MSHLSVIVTDGSAVALEVKAVVADWATAGLVGESAWVCPGDVTLTNGPPQVVATVVGPGGSHRADLFQVIGIRRLDTVRLVVAQFIVTGDDQARELPELGRTLEGLLTSSLPRPMDDGGPGTALRTYNVLIPVSGVSGVTVDALLPGWNANAVVAAEDRPDLDRASIFVRAGANYTGHAAAAVASVAAMWPGIDRGGLDFQETDSTVQDTAVAVVRQTVRAIVHSNDAQDLADAVCASIVIDPTTPARTVNWARPAPEPGGVVDAVFAETMATGDWVVRVPAARPAPTRVQRGFRAAFRDAALFNAQLFAAAFRVLAGRGRRVVENAATGAIIGHDGDQVVRFRPSSIDEIVRRNRAFFETQSGEMREKMLVAEGGSVAAPNPLTWANLRRSCFGLVDGSELAGSYEVPEIAGKPQLLSPSSVVPDPHDRFITSGRVEIRACDAPLAVASMGELKAAVAASVAQAPAADGDADAAEAAEAQAEAALALAKDEVAALEQWIQARRGSLAWRVSDSLATRTEGRLREAATSYASATATTQPAVEAVQRALRHVITAWGVLGVGVVVFSAALWYWPYRQDHMSASDLVKTIEWMLIIALALGVFFNHVYYKAVRHFEWQVQHELARRRETAERFVVANREARRLQLLGSAFNEWAEIIGSVLHRPWNAQPAGVHGPALETLTHLPAAVAVAVPPDKVLEVSPVVRARAIEVLTSRGWANRAFDSGVDAYEAHVRLAREGGHLSADLDTLTSPTSPRGLLWDFFYAGRAAEYATSRARTRIEMALAQGELELPPRAVRRTGEYTDGATVSDVAYFGGALFPAIQFVDDIWTGAGLMREKNVPDKSVAWMPSEAGAKRVGSVDHRLATGDVAVRIDLSRRCDVSDLVVFVQDDVVKVHGAVIGVLKDAKGNVFN
ncbi:hypothetical protein [Pengzhenrongella sp.]|jgi:hypothetical protein|uniref:hypothetical protein n=1 Tax=Pengzhenrongella sp. TaxID=2888820 RepID=UPI002F91D51B